MLCQQYADAPCKNICDSLGFRAIIRRSDGILYVDPALCTGCGRCLPVCPYQAMFFNRQKTSKLGTLGVAEKCHMCMHRIDAGLPPACIITCLTLTREYGDYGTLRTRHPKAKTMGDNLRILYDNLGDEPKPGSDGPTNGFPNGAPFHDY
ncbi:MAG: 4Fe-4S binding protein [Chloroflexi bacterium]|nr:4Fe-4S binding protein [Chloroflexota bacterium]